MKKKWQKSLFILSILMTCFVLSGKSTSAASQYYEHLNHAEKQVYQKALDTLNANTKEGEVKINLPIYWNKKYDNESKMKHDVKKRMLRSGVKIQLAINNDYPELYWFDTISIYYTYTEYNSHRYALNRCYIVLHQHKTNKTEQKLFKKELKKAVKKIKKQRKNKTKKETVKAINRYICKRTTYASGKKATSAWDALIERKAVCEGYSKLYQLLCKKFSIQSRLGCGKTPGNLHMWNYTKIKGKWYVTDVTYNDGCATTKYLFMKTLGERIPFSYSFKI